MSYISAYEIFFLFFGLMPIDSGSVMVTCKAAVVGILYKARRRGTVWEWGGGMGIGTGTGMGRDYLAGGNFGSLRLS